MNIGKIDLNLLLVFDAVFRLRSVSRAADAVGLSQPAVSNALRRLRAQFGDPLFVRTGHGMLPTATAQALGDVVRDAIVRLDAGLRQAGKFSPLTDTSIFTLIMTDVGEIVFLPKLIEFARQHAPNVRFRTAQLTAEESRDSLESGDVSLAIGYVPDLKTSVAQQLLFVTEYVCIVRSEHPTIGQHLSQSQFMQAHHAVAEATGTGHYVIVKALERLNLGPRIGLRVPNFLALPTIVSSSDMVATVPRPLAAVAAQQFPIRIVPTPLKLPKLEIRQFWHVRFHRDPANQWLRRTMASLFRDARWA